MFRRPLPSTIALVAVALAAPLLTSCSSDASTRAEAAERGPTTTAAPVAAPASIPEGTRLRIGDQLDYLETVLSISGQDDDLPYEVEYSTFVGGPPMLQAFQGGSLDAGFVASTPLIFAQAAGQELVAVAGWASDRGLGGLLAADDSIQGWEDLRGKRVAYQRGTSAEAAFLSALDKAGIDPDEVTTVDVPITQINATLEGGSADAGVTTEPLISLYLEGHPDAHVAAENDALTDRAQFLIAHPDALADEARTAALADYLQRLVRAFAWLRDNPDALANAVFVDQYGLTPERADELIEAGSGTTRFFAVPGDVLAEQQELADRFADAGQIPTAIDVASQFDPRFNELVLEEQGS